MSIFSRRKFLAAGGAAAGLALLQSSNVSPAQSCVATRYNLDSAKGKKMLQIYADSVRKMNNPLRYPEFTPLSWMFQWYTHMVRGDRSKAAEMARVFPLGGSALADEMWDTCQSHLGQPEQYFLPWHRMYLNFLEQIVRTVSGDPCFTLPYWDYTNPARQALPSEFRQRNSNRWGPLYRAERYPEINAGTPLPQGQVGLRLDLECMKSGSYNPFNGDAGFCANIDAMVHGAAHLDIGTPLGMASVPWAARDPIFWVHHCNIDRIWASWNRAGGSNPADAPFLDKTFVFANGSGERVAPRIGDVLSVAPAAYDVYLARPAGGLPFQPAASDAAAREMAPAALESNDAGVDGDIRLGGEAVTVPLGAGAGRAALSARAPRTGSTGQPILLIEGRSVTGFAASGFNVYVHAARHSILLPGSPAHVGQLHFFGLEMQHDHADGAHDPSAMSGRDASFVLRDDTRRMLATLDPANLAVTFVPIGAWDESVGAAVRRVALVLR
ncbi:tyrosinase family protein [Pseudoduganella umbonata]|nr:tyrosinase family protein [Pseudoduganella umbonata]MBB3219235.1 hypothetical protein [Pseudoduganella umbonata]